MGVFSGNRRYLALWLPLLPTDRLHRIAKRAGAAPDERPLIVLAKVRGALRIAHADRRARELGLMPGFTFANARARVPDLALADEDQDADRALLECIAGWCDSYTPLIGLDGEDGLLLDITGCAHLFGGEVALRDDAMARLSSQGFTTASAIAGTPNAARALARFCEGGVVAPGEEAASVSPLPTAALGIDGDCVRALARAGLRTIGDLASRPRAPLAARFGPDLIDRLMRVLGEVGHPISPRRPVPDLIAERRFAEPIAHAEDIMGTLYGLAGELVPMLDLRGAGGRSFEASFFRVDGAVRRIRIETGRPLRDPGILAKLFSERLDALTDPVNPGFGFDMIRLSVLAAEAAVSPQARLDGGHGDEEAVTDLLDRLGARYGPERILRFASSNSHVPECMSRLVPAISAPGQNDWPERALGEPPTQPLCLFDPPQPIDAIAEVPDGPPVCFRWRQAMHEVAAVEGPERIAPEWWRQDGESQTRDYFRVEDREGRRFWLFRDELQEAKHPRWFLHGLFA